MSKTVACSTGTFRAGSTGSAYNVLNITPAHASGTNVAIKQDQQALVNEVGVNGHAESIVRDGVWSLIPGGAHIENLKRATLYSLLLKLMLFLNMGLFKDMPELMQVALLLLQAL